MSNERIVTGRLAMRVEGDLWVAYWAMRNTMEGALFLGPIRMKLVEDSARKEAFMALMMDAMSDAHRDLFGGSPDWSTAKPAPEHERSGRA